MPTPQRCLDRVETIANADDRLDAHGNQVLNFWQAQDKASELHRQLSGDSGKIFGSYTVEQVIQDYLHWMEGNRKSAQDARYKADALILPEPGGTDLSKLTAATMRKWQATARCAERRRCAAVQATRGG